MVPDPPLSDGVVALRVPSEQDLPAIERGLVDLDVVRWFGPPEHTARELLELNWTRWTRGIGATFSVCDRNDACLGHVWVNAGGLKSWQRGVLAPARGKRKGPRDSLRATGLPMGARGAGARPTLRVYGALKRPIPTGGKEERLCEGGRSSVICGSRRQARRQPSLLVSPSRPRLGRNGIALPWLKCCYSL